MSLPLDDLVTVKYQFVFSHGNVAYAITFAASLV